MADPVAFIRARIEEERDDAEAAPHGPWDWIALGESNYPQRVTNGAATVIAHCYENPDSLASCATHITRQDPAATLARCEALTALVDVHHIGGGWAPGEADVVCARCQTEGDDVREPWPCEVLRRVAAIWRDHADYRTEWTADA